MQTDPHSMIKTLPHLPGVYLFVSQQGEILYIGKAKNLKRRISSYFKTTNNPKITQLISDHTHISYIVTHSELQALLLEATLIYQHKPPFNTLLKEGNPFLYLAITKPKKDTLSQLLLVRNKNYDADFYGPFIAKKEARKLYEYLINTFQLHLCNKKIPSGCLDYHIGRCAGICRADFDAPSYNRRLAAAKELLQGNKKNCIAFLKEQINQFNKEMSFEKSRNTTQQIQTLEQLFDALAHKKHEQIYKKDLLRIFSQSLPNKEKYEKAAQKIQQLTNATKPPITIDCFDISHNQSHEIVAASVRFTNGYPDHDAYRRFIIKKITQQNDYAALQEALTRRYKNPANLPDLIVIDGGKGQLSAALKVLPNTTTCVSLAKREERLFTQQQPNGIVLRPDTAIGSLLITLRNHTHNQAISFHRLRAQKTLISKK